MTWIAASRMILFLNQTNASSNLDFLTGSPFWQQQELDKIMGSDKTLRPCQDSNLESPDS